MGDVIRLEQGECVGMSRCPSCDGPIRWKATRHGEKVNVYCTNNFQDEERFGQRCGRRILPSLSESQDLIKAYVANGKTPLRTIDDNGHVKAKTQKAKSNDKIQDTDTRTDDTGTGDDAGTDDTGTDEDTGNDDDGGIFSGLFGG